MITLILARHGETDWNKNGLLQGSSDFAKLNNVGKKQAKALEKALIKFNVDIIYSSSLKRASETAEIINKILKKEIVFDDALKERNWGDWEGRDAAVEFLRLEKMDIRTRFNFKPPNGESWREFEIRLIKSVEKIVENNNDKRVLIVTHGGSIRALVPVIKKVPREQTLHLKFANTSITIFKLNKDDVEEELINDIAHLETT
ncbi:MAG: histidine phosphatase family protein [Candidatus Curtissbacteria bacterium]|nr:histidine phosphatase family protein [Candidatus Curtissbacteria bacterium]